MHNHAMFQLCRVQLNTGDFSYHLFMGELVRGKPRHKQIVDRPQEITRKELANNLLMTWFATD
jgi:hypothetical protein